MILPKYLRTEEYRPSVAANAMVDRRREEKGNRKKHGQVYPAIVSAELMDQAKEQISSRATALGRNFEPKEKEKLAVQKKFALGHLEHRYEDPFRQAEYAYSLIEEVQTNG
jgi:hypothetical protein